MEEKTHNEINLIDIFVVIINWLKKVVAAFLSFLGHFFKLIFRHKILVLITSLVFIAVGAYLARPSARVYKLEGMGMLYGTDAATVTEIVKPLEKFSQKFASTSLKSKLNLPDSVIKRVVLVDFYKVIANKRDSFPSKIDIKRNHSYSDTAVIVLKDHIYVSIKMLGTNHGNDVGNEILNFVNSNPVAKENLIVLRQSLNDQIKLCDREMARIDSMAKVTYFKDSRNNVKFENNRLIVGEERKQLFYNDLLFLQRSKAFAQKTLEQAKQPLVIPGGLTLNPIAENQFLKNSAKYLLAGFALAVIIAYIIENYKKWIKFLKEK